MPSKDPKQQALRNHKKQWSAATSALISRIIDFKRSVNGRGAAKMGIPPSKIGDPLPEEVSSALSQLTAEFQKIVGDAESIIAQQAEYSRTRRKKQPKKPRPAAAPIAGAPTPAAPAPEAGGGAPPAVVQQLQALTSLNAFEIEKYGSTRLSRFWEYLKGVFVRTNYRRSRLGMLSLTADLFYNTLDFQNAVLTVGVKNIPNAMVKYQNLHNTYKALMGLFNQVSKSLVETAKNEGVEPPKPQEPQEGVAQPEKQPQKPQQGGTIYLDEEPTTVADQITKDLKVIFSLQLINPIKAARLRKLLIEQPTNVNELQSEYKKILAELFLRAQQEYGPAKINSLQDVVELARKNAAFANDILEKYASNPVTRFLRKQLAKMLPFDKTAAPRLQASDVADEMKTTLRRLMSILEEDITVDEMVLLIKKVGEQIGRIGKYMSVLSLFAKERLLEGDHERDIDVAMRRRLRRDILRELE